MSDHSMFGLKTIARAVAIGIPIMGAIPTAINVYYGWRHDIPWWDVPYRIEQARLWEDNGACSISYKPLPTRVKMDLSVGSCPGTNDISLMISAKGRDTIYTWIAFRSLRKPGQSYSFMDSLIPPLRAAMKSRSDVRVAQVTSKVLCQSREGSNIVRVISQSNKCFRETFSPFKGRVEKIEEIPCKDACPAPAKKPS